MYCGVAGAAAGRVDACFAREWGLALFVFVRVCDFDFTVFFAMTLIQFAMQRSEQLVDSAFIQLHGIVVQVTVG